MSGSDDPERQGVAPTALAPATPRPRSEGIAPTPVPGMAPTAVGTGVPGTTTVDAPDVADVRLGERYEVKRLLGRGGMGAVYLARDTTLGRDVAVKLHGAGSAGGDRLHREAVAMAKLAHPNVVTVFEVASHEDRLYVAMEYVRGGTLRTWLGAATRSWRDIVAILCDAGEGLAAAHDAGLVHRDFKPENVLVGEDGRPRVGDFGIAHLGTRASDRVISLVSQDDLTTPMTVTGSVLGTPAYMAPEQLAGDPVDARADQFAFCVVVWECLFGKRPFGGNSLASLGAAIELQKFERPVKTEVPPRVLEVIERGLAAEPDARFPDMRALLAALRKASARRTRRWLAVGGALAVAPVAVIATLAATGGEQRASMCDVPADALAGAWDAKVDATLRTRFAAARPRDGVEIHGRLAGALDAYAQAWTGARRGACEATRVRGEQSEAALDLRIACLDRKRAELAALTTELAQADDKVAMNALRAVFGLSTLAECDDVTALAAPVRPPDPYVRARVDALRAELAAARALRLLGKFKPGLAKAQAVAAEAKQLGYRPVEAEALLIAGDLTERAGGDAAGAIKLLEQAVVAANAGKALLVAAEAWSQLAWVLGYRERKFERAHLAVQMASSALEGAGGHPELAAQLQSYEGLVFETQGKLAEARTRYEAALAAYAKLGDEDGAKASLVLNDLGGVLRKLGDYGAARAMHERALANRRRLFGEHHPYVFSSLINLGNVAFSEDDPATAQTFFEQALAVATVVFPPQHPQTALALGNLGSALEHQEKLDEAIARHREALAMVEALRGPTHPATADALRQVATIEVRREKLDLAAEAFERALTIMTEAEDDPLLFYILADYGGILVRRDGKRAEPLLQRAVELGGDDVAIADPLTSLGELYRLTKRPREAREALDRALALRAKDPDVDPEQYATTELALAELLWPTDRPRATELGKSASARLAAMKNPTPEGKRKVASWLAVRGIH